MTKAMLCLAGVALFLGSTPAHAQYFQFQSAETIDKGTFKLGAYPALLFGEDDEEDSLGVAARLGYGFTERFDVEARLGFFDGFTMYGGDAEYWVVKGRSVDVSLSAGFHLADFDSGVDSTAFDVAALVSGKFGDKLDGYVGVHVSFESLDEVEDSSFERFYIAPGLEYRVHPDLDLVFEFGLGLNEDSPNYLGAGVSFYIR